MCKSLCGHTRVCVEVHVYVGTYVHVCMSVWACVCVCPCEHTCVCMCVGVGVGTCVCVSAHQCGHTCTGACADGCQSSPSVLHLPLFQFKWFITQNTESFCVNLLPTIGSALNPLYFWGRVPHLTWSSLRSKPVSRGYAWLCLSSNGSTGVCHHAKIFT